MKSLADFTRGLVDSAGSPREMEDTERREGQIVDEELLEDGRLAYWFHGSECDGPGPNLDAEAVAAWQAQKIRRQAGASERGGTKSRRAPSPLSGAARQIKKKKRIKKTGRPDARSVSVKQESSDESASRKRGHSGHDLPSPKRRRGSSQPAEEALREYTASHDSQLVSSDRHVIADSQAADNLPDSSSSGQNCSQGEAIVQRTADGRLLHQVQVPGAEVLQRYQQQEEPASPVADSSARMPTSPIETSSQMPSQSGASVPPPPLNKAYARPVPIGDGVWAKSQPVPFKSHKSADPPKNTPADDRADLGEGRDEELQSSRSDISGRSAVIMSDLKKQVESAKKGQAAAEAKLSELTEQAAARATELSQQRERAQTQETHFQMLKDRLAAKALQSTVLQDRVADLQRQIETLMQDRLGQANELAGVKAELEAERLRAAGLGAALVGAREEVHREQAQKATWMAQYQAASRTAEERLQEQHALSAEIDRLRRALDLGVRQVQHHATASMRAAKAEASQYAAQARFARNGMEPLSRQLEKQNARVQHLEANLQALQDRCADLQARVQRQGNAVLDAAHRPPERLLAPAVPAATDNADLDDDEDEDSLFESDEDGADSEDAPFEVDRSPSPSSPAASCAEELVRACEWRTVDGFCDVECEDPGTLISHIHLQHIFA